MSPKTLLSKTPVTIGGRAVREIENGLAGGWRRVTFADDTVRTMTLREIEATMTAPAAVFDDVEAMGR